MRRCFAFKQTGLPVSPTIKIKLQNGKKMKRIQLKKLFFLAFCVFLLLYLFSFCQKDKQLIESIENRTFCSPQTNILFLKTHKTASETIRNLLLRFVKRHQLLLATPSLDFYLYFEQHFRPGMLLGFKSGRRPSVFAEHARFNYPAMRASMPEESAFVTILRHPVANFESVFAYEELELRYGMNLSAFLRLDQSHPVWAEVREHQRKSRVGPNHMAFDLGIEPELFDNRSAILEKVQELDRQFDLVMITELMDESLVLLRRLLCWSDFSDVAALKINARTSAFKQELSPEDKERIRKINSADLLIYEYFYEKFQKRVSDFGTEMMKAEVMQLSSVTQYLNELCVKNENSSAKDEMIQIVHLSNNSAVCKELVVDGLELFFAQKQYYDVSEVTSAILDVMQLMVPKLKSFFKWASVENKRQIFAFQ